MKNFFKNNSDYSMGRLLSLITTIAGIVIGIIFSLTGKLNTSSVTLILGMISLGIAGKTITAIKNK